MSSSAFDSAIGELAITTRKEIVFIEDNVADIDTLIKGIGSGKEIVILDSTRDGLHQMAEALAGRSGIDALHIISHGGTGTVSLGSLMLDGGNLGAHQDDLQAIGRSLSADGDILLYGCDTGAGDGAGFVQQLAIATGADVAASEDRTGSAALGGNWDLEVRAGQVETASAATPELAALYAHVLNLADKTVTFSTDANFVNGRPTNIDGAASLDVVYKVGGDDNYRLVIDASHSAVASYAIGNAYVNLAGQTYSAHENLVTLSFQNGQLFTLTDLQFSTFQNLPPADPSPSISQTLILTGLDSNNNVIKSTSYLVPRGVGYSTLHLTGFTDVKKITITTADNGGSLTFVAMDNLVFGEAHLPDTVPPTLSISSSKAALIAGETATITFTFSEDPGTSFTAADVTVGGGTLSAISSTGTTRTATFTPTANTNSGTGSISVSAGSFADAAGNVNTASSSSPSITYDTLAPNAPSAPDLSTGSDSGSSNTDNITSQKTGLVFTGTTEAGVTVVKLYDTDGTTEIASTSTFSGTTYTITTTGNLADGAHTVKVKAFDAAGNASAASGSLNVTVDSAAPNAPTAPDLTSDSGISNTDNLTNINTGLVFTGTTEAGVTSLKLYEGATEIPSTSTISGGTNYTITTTSALADGVHALTVKAFDAAGNASAVSGSLNVTVDSVAPTVSITADKTTLKAGETAAITFTFSEDPGATFTWSGSAGDVSVSGGTLSAITGTGTSRSAIFTPTINTNGGSASISVSAGSFADAAGNSNTASSSSPSITYDTLAPNAPTAPDLSAGSDSGISNADNLTNIKTGLVFTGTTEAGVTSLKLYEGTTEIASTSSISGTTFTITTTSALADGVHALTVKAFDAAGNASAASGSLNVTVDTVAPTASITVDATQTLKAGDSAHYTIHFSEDPGASFTLSDIDYSGGPPSSVSPTGLDREVLYVPPANSNGGAASISVAANRYSDAAGNFNTTSSSSPSITYDTFPPNAPSAPDLSTASDSGKSSTDNITNIDTGLVFTGSTEAGVTSLKLYEGTTEIASTSTISGTSYTITTTGTLGSGTHTLTAKAFDAAGNASPASGSLNVTIDMTAPAAPSAPDLDTGSDSGSSDTDDLTAAANPSFSGTAEAGATVNLYDSNGTTQIGSGTANGSGNWTIAIGSPLSDGTHTITAKAVDAAGNASSASGSLAVTVDRTPPTVSVSSSVASLKAGETATITFTFSEDPGTSFSWDGTAGDITVSGGTLSALSGTGNTRTATFTPNANTDAGSASIQVVNASYQDAAGNNGTASNNLTLTYDTRAPGAPSVPVLAAGDDSGASDSDGVTNDTTLSFSGTAEAGATVRLYDGATQIGSATATGGTYTIPVAGLAEGNHSLTAVAIDAAGNASPASGTLSLVVDTTPPTTTVSSAALSSDTGDSVTDMITRIDSQTISGTLSANLSAGERVMVSLDNGATWNPAIASAGSNTWSLNATLSGSNTLKVKVEDLAGNGGTVYSHAYVIDQVAPAAPSTPDLDAGSDSGASDTDNVTGVTAPSFSGTAEIGSTVRLFDGGIEIGSFVVVDGSWHITTGNGVTMGQRIHYITAQASDVAGNVAASAALEVDVRTTAPATTIASMALSADSGAAGDFITNASSQTISGLLSANLATGERVQVSLDGGASWNNATATVGSKAWSIAAALAAGTHDIKVRVTDPIDNSGPVHTQAYTLDSVSPTVAITSSASSLKAGETATITFTFSEDPGTSFSWDGTAGDITVSGGTLSAMSGAGTVRTAIFTPAANVDAGTASITVTASYQDAAGNTGASATLPAIVFDTLAPTAPSAPDLAGADDSGVSSTDNITNDPTTSFSGTAQSGATVKLYDGALEIGSTTATGGNWTIPVSNLAEGSHALTAKAFDAAGNASAASGPLTLVVDKTPPTTTVSSAQLSADTGASATDMITSASGAQVITGALSANLAAGERVMVSIDNGATWTAAVAAVGANTWSLTTALTASNVLKVQVLDQAGNGGAVYSHAYVIDTSAPAAPAAPDLDAGSDSGSSNIDNITAVTQPGFSGTAEIGATVRLYDGATEIGHVVATDGTWHIASDTPLGKGSHSITATATDVAGNTSAASSPLAVQILTSGPATGIASMALSVDSGAAGDFITNTQAQTISGLLDGALALGERVQVSLDGGGSWLDAAGAIGSKAWSIAASLTAGTHDIRVRVIDAVDNTGPVHTQAYTLDSVNPTVAITSSASSLKAGDTATITFTFSEDPGSSFSWDGSAGDLTVSGGTLSAISGTGTVRTATFTPAANLNGGSAGIAVNAASYADTAGNPGAASATLSLGFDTLAPDAPSAPDLDKGSDSGVSDTDNLTRETTPVFTGTAEAGATVRLYDSDGTTEIGHATATGGIWQITAAALGEGSHTVTAKAFDAAGNASVASGAISITVDSAKPAAMAAPTLALVSDSGVPGDGISKVATPLFSGSAEALAQVTLYDGATAIGTVKAGADGAWQLKAPALLDGVHAISARQTDLAGNVSDAGAPFSLTVDTVAPAAPGAPLLKASSDTGAIGDGVTINNLPVIEGTALANSLVTLYDGTGTGRLKLGTAMSDGAGKWSIATTGMSIGMHTLSATQSDAAGNESAASADFTLRIDAPPQPVNLIDGVPVSIQPISLPGGVIGSAVSIPLVSVGRTESSGQPSVADIPLITSSQGATVLLAQLGVGYGLSASGASVPVANAAEFLIASIKAATPTHAASDQGHLTGNGQSFLAGLASTGSLLVETVKPVSSATPEGLLTLTGQAPGAGQSTALVIDAGSLAAGATLALQQVDFAAVIGAANVVARSSMVLTGDGASQHFTVAAGGSGSVFAGGGNDVLSVAAIPAAGPAPAAGTTLLHGGAASDAATFSGARADYNIEVHNGYVIVSSKSAPTLKAMVVNVEQLQFSDTSVAVQNSPDMDILAGMYQGVLGRQADVMGIEYWANVHQAGASWGAIALSMISSTEHAASHEGFNGVAAHDVALLYAAIFNRDPDAGGLAYWTAAMGRGVSLEQVASSFVQSAEMIGHQRAATDWDFIVA
jgi:predicted secreted protein